ncbi:response regulator transcription factor [Pseudoduganella namucuonensis]|uniref:DNA-binding response regulator, OmpR family, contains REC and winged-helix (WHTH) domain n=1 Tax=Pseudoduganella namucuonensis TaxID=1035707 RepID=A0A1I7HRY6_9BURK|nr:response regulator transcription factor [Pseudoduganella namucuonensis]SFU63411.1 DNA-binding response regulator, OmpR family, contains REC and winged-helix (wHTH) domain [Pseudoduganella namucuonensis]
MHVLLVEDDAVLADGLNRILTGHGMAVDVLRSGTDADALLQRAEAAEVAVVVLDIGLPGIDGFEVVRRLRARGNHTPVLLLTARDAIEDRVRGLELGADDYLVKPFATPELVARLRALVRRNAPKPAVLALGDLALDGDTKRARVKDRTIELSAREWAVLEYLLQHGARVVSKQQIIDAILPWGEEMTLNAVEVYISRLRLKIADAGITIRTIRGFGYMLEQTPSAGA